MVFRRDATPGICALLYAAKVGPANRLVRAVAPFIFLFFFFFVDAALPLMLRYFLSLGIISC
ncbi:hypothetical protein LY78DRAFT_656061 [Colletotrichum sublineola]|nr:hypothetical protein LY78DRAFT_656061 [Colletotrichum sublineola]